MGRGSTLFDFACPACSFRWEDWAPMHGPKTSTCPECGEAGRRAFSAFASPVSFGKFMWPQRTPTARMKPRRDDEDRTIWQAKKAAGDTTHPAGKG